MKNGRVRWGIVGCGDVVNRKSGPAFQRAHRSELVAVMRRSAELAERFAAKHGVPHWTTDANELIDNPEVDAVYIASPPMTHLDYALRVCAAGKPCLVEKPIGRSSVECREMTEAFAKRGLPLFVSYYRRYLPKFLKVKEILESGILGPIVAVHYRCDGPGKTKPWKFNPRLSGGGIFYDIGGHVLDLLDFWFGALHLIGGEAANFSRTHDTEDAVSLVFQTGDRTIGTASWNFLATDGGDLMEIEGVNGKIKLSCANYESPCTLERYVMDDGSSAILSKQKVKNTARRIAGKPKKARLRTMAERFEFSSISYQHQPLVQSVVDCILDGTACQTTGESSLKTSEITDAVLSEYYGGRQDAFWERPHTWQSASALALLHRGTDRHFQLTPAQVEFYEKNGYVGPFKCESTALKQLNVPIHGRVDFHLNDPIALDVFSDPSIIDRVKQVLHSDGALLFKSRPWIKQPKSTVAAPWHQDVGQSNGGYLPDGQPVPSVTVWFALDGATKSNGAVKVLPGTHTKLFGDWHDSINTGIEESGALDGFDLEGAPILEAAAGEFFLMHSWLLHASGPNASDKRRAGINIRYVAPGHDVDPTYHYVRVG